jgi:cytochrome c-type biogenesis protein CcmH
MRHARPSPIGATTSSAHRLSTLALRDDAGGAGNADVIRVSALLDTHDRRVRLDRGDEIFQKRVRVHRFLLGVATSAQSGATRVPPRVARALVLTLVLLVALGGSAAATHVSEQTVHDVSAQLRCVVCQNLSVADSPSEMAGQMRAIVREHLEAGQTPEQVREYFVARYGEWILLAPRRSGFNLLVWGFPLAAVAVGFAVVALLLRRWTRRRRGSVAPPVVDPTMRERIQRELEAE